MATASSSYALEDQRRMSAAKNYFSWQRSLVQAHLGRRIVDVGCGIGNFTKFLLDRELVIAVDSDPDCIEELQRRFAGQANLHPVWADATDLRTLSRFEPDSCVCMNALEHFARDGEAIAAMADLLPSGGKIVLLLPAFPALYGPADRKLGHYRRYRRADVAALARGAALEVATLHYVNFPGFFGWWINARLLRLDQQSAAQIRLFDRFVVPVMAAVEKLAPPPFGQSILAVLVKQ